MTRSEHRQITSYAILYLYREAEPVWARRLIRACADRERLSWHLHPSEQHALRIPFAGDAQTLQLIILQYREYILQLSDAHSKGQVRRMLLIAGSAIHLLQDLCIHSTLPEHDSEEVKLACGAILRAQNPDIKVKIYAKRRFCWPSSVCDPFTKGLRYEAEHHSASKDLALWLTIGFFERFNHIFSNL